MERRVGSLGGAWNGTEAWFHRAIHGRDGTTSQIEYLRLLPITDKLQFLSFIRTHGTKSYVSIYACSHKMTKHLCSKTYMHAGKRR